MGSVGKGSQSVKDYVLSQLGIKESFPEERQPLDAEVKMLSKERQKLNSRFMEINEELKSERTVDAELVKEFGRSTAEILADYTERGKELQKEQREVMERERQVERRLEEISDRFDALDEAVYKAETLTWSGKAPYKPNPPITQKEVDRDYKSGYIKGFSSDTATPMMKDAFEKGNAYIVYMSPKEYLERISHDSFGGSLERGVRGVNWDNIKKYAKEMKAGTRYYMPWIEYSSNKSLEHGQEGRHRALAAVLNGYERIPVAIRVK